jgi:hypothetical protein
MTRSSLPAAVRWLACALPFVVACAGAEMSGPSSTARTARVAITPAVFAGDSSLFPRDSAQLRAVAYDSVGSVLSGVEFTWGTDDSAVVDVSATGMLHARGLGRTTAWVRANGHYEPVSVLVRPRLATIELLATSYGAVPGGAFRIGWTLRDSSGAVLAPRPIQAASSNPAVATVDSAGRVQAKAVGTA